MSQITPVSFRNAINKLSSGILLSTSLLIITLPMSSMAHVIPHEKSRPIEPLQQIFATCNNETDSIHLPSAKVKVTTSNQKSQQINCLLTQLNDYQNTEHTPRQRYFAYKAQAWLNYATHEISIKSKTNAANHALQTATDIIDHLYKAQDHQLSMTTNIPTTSALMRPDLWATLNALKDSQGINSAPRELAFSEVALIWGAADQCKHGEPQSGAHFRMSERWLEQAREAYINAHPSDENVALEARINHYFKQYSPLEASDDHCRGQVLPLTSLNSAQNIKDTDIHTVNIPIPNQKTDNQKNDNQQTLDNHSQNSDYLQIKVLRTITSRHTDNAVPFSTPTVLTTP